MADEPFSRFTSKLLGKPPTAAPSKAPPLPPSLVPPESEGRTAYEAYEPFQNEIRTTNVELRCFRSGLSYFVPYSHMGVMVFNFRTGSEIFLTGGGYAVTITGRNLRAIVMALRLHTCGTIQDFSEDAFIVPQPEDRNAPFVQSIAVEVLRPAPKDADEGK